MSWWTHTNMSKLRGHIQAQCDAVRDYNSFLMVGKERKRQREGSIKKVRAAWGPRTATKCTLYLKLITWLS